MPQGAAPGVQRYSCKPQEIHHEPRSPAGSSIPSRRSPLAGPALGRLDQSGRPDEMVLPPALESRRVRHRPATRRHFPDRDAITGRHQHARQPRHLPRWSNRSNGWSGRTRSGPAFGRSQNRKTNTLASSSWSTCASQRGRMAAPTMQRLSCIRIRQEEKAMPTWALNRVGDWRSTSWSN